MTMPNPYSEEDQQHARDVLACKVEGNVLAAQNVLAGEPPWSATVFTDGHFTTKHGDQSVVKTWAEKQPGYILQVKREDRP